MPRGLGIDYDLSIGVAPSDLSVAASTGKRIYMSDLRSVDVVIIKGAGTAADDPTVTLVASDAQTGGTSANLTAISAYHLKDGATLAGTETWSKLTQSAAATIADPGGAGTSAEHQQICVISVNPSDMPAGKPYLSLNIADVGSNAQLGAVIYILHQNVREVPASLPAPLR
jgi:hypothetical protein